MKSNSNSIFQSPIRTPSSKPCTLNKEAQRRRKRGEDKRRRAQQREAKQKARNKRKAGAGGVNTDRTKEEKKEKRNKRSKKQKERRKVKASQEEGGAPTLTFFISFAASLSFCLVPYSARSPQAISP
ncbi:hypothetical protein ACLB2K_012674 [Fragaria x ananassa]